MKRTVFFVLAIILCLPGLTQAANVYIEGGGNYGDYGDAKKMTGFGSGVGVSVAQDVNVFLRYFRATGSEKKTGTKPFEYKEESWIVAGEYNFPLKGMPLMWTSSVGAGYSRARIYAYSSKKDDSGTFLGAWTGLKYIFSQHIGLYALVGYHTVTGLKNDLINDKIRGYQLAIGVTGTIWGENNTLSSDF